MSAVVGIASPDDRRASSSDRPEGWNDPEATCDGGAAVPAEDNVSVEDDIRSMALSFVIIDLSDADI